LTAYDKKRPTKTQPDGSNYFTIYMGRDQGLRTIVVADKAQQSNLQTVAEVF